MTVIESLGVSFKLWPQTSFNVAEDGNSLQKKLHFTETSEGGKELCPLMGFVFLVVYWVKDSELLMDFVW